MKLWRPPTPKEEPARVGTGRVCPDCGEPAVCGDPAAGCELCWAVRAARWDWRGGVPLELRMARARRDAET